MATNAPTTMTPREEDIQKMLACQVHIGTHNLDFQMAPYVWTRRTDGVHLINVAKTYEKLQLAARIIVTIENPADICVISARPYGQRAVLKFAQFIGAQAIAGRYTPGTFTNQIQEKFIEPRLLICTDPRIDHQPIREASYVNLPVIALCDTDSPLRYVDVAIPANNKGKLSIGLLYWMLAREVLRLRGTIQRHLPWEVMIDVFFYRDPDEQEKAEEAAAAPALGYEDGAKADGEYTQEWTSAPADSTWETPANQDWTAGGQTAEWGATDAAPAPGQGW